MRLRIGDEVVRRQRALKTHGQVVRVTDRTRDGVRLLWVKWNHPETFPNPSLEMEDTLELVTTAAAVLDAAPDGRGWPLKNDRPQDV